MEQRIEFAGSKILLTTGANRQECQQWAWHDDADIVISVLPETVAILKCELP
jgi:hypothetical protein